MFSYDSPHYTHKAVVSTPLVRATDIPDPMTNTSESSTFR